LPVSELGGTTQMSHFGQILCGRSGFIRWALTPFVLAFAILMPLCIDNWTPMRAALMLGMELMCLALLSGFRRRVNGVGFRLD
jgi:hypothetical protein